MAAHLLELESEDEDISAINIIPFVDIVLVLLIIFMVTSTAIVRASMQVDLPKAASAGDTVDSTLNIVLTRNDELILNGEVATADQVATFVRTEVVSHPELRAVIAADKGAPYGRVVEVIDLVKRNGVKTFALNIERDV